MAVPEDEPLRWRVIVSGPHMLEPMFQPQKRIAGGFPTRQEAETYASWIKSVYALKLAEGACVVSVVQFDV